MRRPASICLLSLVLAALGPGAGAQELPSVPTGPGFVAPVFATQGTETVQFTVDVIGRATPVSGSAGDHFLTFSGPVEVPGIALAPGTYVFRLLSASVMQVVSADRTTSYSMFLVTPTLRAEATGTHEVVLRRTTDGAPMRLVGLFVPNRVVGYEPVYAQLSACERTLRDLNLPTTICSDKSGL